MTPYVVAASIAFVLGAWVTVVAFFMGRDRLWDDYLRHLAEHETACDAYESEK